MLSLLAVINLKGKFNKKNYCFASVVIELMWDAVNFFSTALVGELKHTCSEVANSLQSKEAKSKETKFHSTISCKKAAAFALKSFSCYQKD